MDTVGAFAGPLIAMAVMALSGGNIRLVFWIAVIPAFLALAVLIRGVEEPERKDRSARPAFDRHLVGALGGAFWAIAALGAVMSFARISEAFLILSASANGLETALAPAVLVALNIVYAVVAWPVGVLSDRIGRRGLLILSLVVLAAAHLMLAFSVSLLMTFAGVLLWGLHMGLSQGLLSAVIADTVPAHLRGTGFGLFNLISGLAVLVANTFAGALWAYASPSATFILGAVAAAVALTLTGRIRN
jgi:MFS family permease